ncbi:hypothetical protein IQ13_4258 [Lacibacter cauensis]|uniref:Uncharacterized protein n=1 Tax=Lacibacter cauensis TaxID=510947 RepID=A0A562SAZ3_9BACT|nr:hypothetical protein [Lacibacter cauensis]TWI78014.1 hypothetical protein IQ13_4258 [Lacibacter cauensis]
MRLSHPEYIKLVFRTYQMLRSQPECSPALKQPTPAGIRNECLTVYKERPEKKDEPVLRSFFGPAENNSFLAPIEKMSTVRFKSFANYLTGKAINTDNKNVELLAWLIDFQHRPFRLGMDVLLNETEKTIINSDDKTVPSQHTELHTGSNSYEEDVQYSSETLQQHPDNLTAANTAPEVYEREPRLTTGIHNDQSLSDGQRLSAWMSPEKKESNNKKKWVILVIALSCSFLSLTAYLLLDNSNKCMYWAGDHYERIDCDEDVHNKVVFNEERWKNFKKITDLSSITESSIGVVHYYGNKNREFFTTGGKHPVESNRYLKVMTRYIWEKDFGSKDSTVKDTSTNERIKAIVH